MSSARVFQVELPGRNRSVVPGVLLPTLAGFSSARSPDTSSVEMLDAAAPEPSMRRPDSSAATRFERIRGRLRQVRARPWAQNAVHLDLSAEPGARGVALVDRDGVLPYPAGTA